jgi:peptide/nickel transport system permease protein
MVGGMSGAVWAMVARRVASAGLTLVMVSGLIFALAGLLPGDAAQESLGQSATPEQVAALRHAMGLDQGALVRYGQWIGGLLRGDPGQSLVAGMPVRAIIAERLPHTLMLAGMTAGLAVPLALLLGVMAAVRRGTWVDRAINLVSLSMVAMPEFLVATIGVLIFSVKLMWLPSIAMVSAEASWGETLRSCALPVVCLTVVVVAQMARMTRAAIADQMDRTYVEMARLKGASTRRIVLWHILPNCIGPIVNAMALSLSYLMGGAIIVETIFNFPGLASLMVNAVTSRDMPLLQACAMIFCAAYLVLMLVADVVATLANPRLRAK